MLDKTNCITSARVITKANNIVLSIEKRLRYMLKIKNSIKIARIA